MKLRGLYAITPEGAGRCSSKVRRRSKAASRCCSTGARRRDARTRRGRSSRSRAATACRSSSTTTSSSRSSSTRTACIWAATTAISRGARQADGEAARRLVLRRPRSSRARRSLRAPTTSPSAACSLRRPSRPRCARRSTLFARTSACRSARSAASRSKTRRSVIAAGADLLAVISDLFDAPDIARRARREYQKALPMKNQALFERAQRRHPRRREFAGARLPRRRRHAARSSSAPRAPISGTPTAGATSTTSARGARWSSATRIPRWSRRCRRPLRARFRSARRPRPRSSWPSCCAGWCPRIELVRLVSSGTEATMSAIRLARGFTGRSRIVKFEGCYHGHADSLLVKAGSGALTFGNPSSAGVPAEIAAHTAGARLQRRRAGSNELFATHGDEIACGHRRAGRRQHEPRAARAGIPRSAARAMHAATARC